MDLYPELTKALDAGDMIEARSVLILYATQNPLKAKKAENYAQIRTNELFVKHDPILNPMTDTESEWDNDYLSRQAWNLMNNFSLPRFDHLMKVSTFLLSDKEQNQIESSDSVTNVNEIDSEGSSNSYSQSSHYSDADTDTQNNALMYIFIAAGIVIAIPLALWLFFKN